jgi:hypothetical protein
VNCDLSALAHGIITRLFYMLNHNMVALADRQEMSRGSINRLFDGTYSARTMSVVHPGSDSSSTDSSGKAKASATQRKVADQIPYQGSELHHRGE